MNNYIPLNKAVGPKVICDGYQALIPQKLGVDAMTFNFDGSECEHATCPGAPEMFIKVEEDGLYYFGVEADDSGSITITGDKLCEKKGDKPNGKLNIKTASRYLKAGYYKVALSWTNNAYDPTSNNAIAFNVTMDKEPIQEGKYEGDSTMKREFSPSPKIKLWTIERESDIKCEESKEVEYEFKKPKTTYLDEDNACTTRGTKPSIVVTVCKDEAAKLWRTRVVAVSGGADVVIRTGGYRDATLNPPKTEAEAITAVNSMNGYQSRPGVGAWHTKEASSAHENHHCRQYEDAGKFFWKHMKIQEKIEEKTFNIESVPDMDTVIQFAQEYANTLTERFWLEVDNYVRGLPDDANDRPYCAGQQALNEATRQVIQQAKANGWSNVPDQITEPGAIEPPCFKPPVSEGETRSMAVAEEPSPLKLSIADTSRFAEGRITLCFRNEGNQPIRIPDEINDETADYFFLTVLRSEQGNVRILNAETGKITFNRPLNYRELSPGQEYSVTIPVCLGQVELEDWKQCSCELETSYYNQQGKDCFLGTLRATAKLSL